MSSIEIMERRFDVETRDLAPDFNEAIRRRIATKLRDLYAPVTDEALPNAHVELLLALRHKERDRQRAA